MFGGGSNAAEWKYCWGQGPVGASDVCGKADGARDDVYDLVEQLYGYNPGDQPSGPGVGNAYQHQLYAGLLTLRVGERHARDLLSAHERIDGQPESSYLMDEWNNSLGIEAANAASEGFVSDLDARGIDAYMKGSVLSAEDRLVTIVRHNMAVGEFVAVDRDKAYVE